MSAVFVYIVVALSLLLSYNAGKKLYISHTLLSLKPVHWLVSSQ